MLVTSTRRKVLSSAGPVLVFGGPYSNLQATQAIRAVAEARGIPPERCICTGDVVGYCADPEATIDEIRDWGCHVIAGNVERQLAEGALDCGCGFEAGSVCDRLAAGWYAHANARVGAAARAWMAALPDVLCFEDKTRGPVWVLHGGSDAVNRFVWPDTSAEGLEAQIAGLAPASSPRGPKVVLAGHSGMPFMTPVQNGLWVNAGVIGLPPNDGAPLTRYAILHGDGQAEICALSYDFEAAAQAMEQAGLTQGYHYALRSGWWPSEDILPAGLRRQSLARG
ncbi:metallophosphoesterase family protein [Primorskyibacter sp. 2E107]|uniref:metallophosphoesterase family protein n=1 Tax=Primorskyibacter sp. 2E107 TaxID=3403458 RepID=UPI003AF856EE